MNLSGMSLATTPYRGKRVLVTGATGFVGRHLLRALCGGPAEVAVITRDADCALDVDRVYAGNIWHKDFVQHAMREWAPQVVFHLAGARERELQRDAFERTIETNLSGSLNLLFAALHAPQLERIVVLGTGEEYGGNPAPFVETMREAPVSAYSFSKQCATHLSQLMHGSFGLPVVVIRPSVAYGPGQQSDMFLPALIQTLLRGEEFAMTLGEQTRDYVFVEDLVDALLRAGTCADVDGEIINVGSGCATRISSLVERVEAQLSRTGLVRRGALAYRNGEQMAYVLDVAKAQALLSWQAGTSLDDGLLRTIAWYRDASR